MKRSTTAFCLVLALSAITFASSAEARWVWRPIRGHWMWVWVR